MGKTYTYDQLKKAASEAKAGLFSKGMPVKKSARRKARDREKEEMLFKRALNRMEQYPPYREGDKIVLPYFQIKTK